MPIPSRTSPRLQQVPLRPYAALPIGWAVVVLVLTLTPSDEMPRTPVWELLSFDTAAHAGVFFVLAALSWFSLHRQRRWPWLAHHAVATTLVGSVLFGALIEVLQMTMKLGRHGEWSDLISDSIGAGLAVGLATAWAARQARQNKFLAAVVCWLGLMLATTTAQAQDIARARHTIETLASEKMHGRGYVQQGEHIAAEYLRKRFRELKLTPLAPNYTQPFTLDVNTFPGKIMLAFGDSAMWSGGRPLWREAPLRPGLDYIAAPASAGTVGATRWVPLVELPDSAILVNAGSTWWQWANRQPRHKWALVLPQRALPLLGALPPPLRQRLDSVARLTIVPKLTASIGSEVAPNVRFEVLAQSWGAFAGRARVAAPIAHYLGFALDAQVQRNYQTQNLAAVIRGSAQPDSFLVVSAHYDHLGTMGRDVYFPGGNDNASGVSMLLELAAHYAQPANRPAYSVVFLLFGAEEAGLVGSQYFVAHPLVPLQNIKFLVNLDLLGTGEQGATVVNGKVFEAPYKRLVALNDAHHYLPALGARGKAANSDHYPFSEAGVPAFFLYTRGGSTAYHDVNDKPAALSLAGFAGAFGLVRDFLNEKGAAPTQKNSR
ncbi:VanZ family protein [Hymenobacter rubidus]|uniref:VanZ family protein n=1 Tax=Hymenobacter rubidus TaxID=1441626 RepID=UPI00191E2B50|nr:VanZ family protein [Hymenobacter rubidus]